jgi:hypothetical protein
MVLLIHVFVFDIFVFLCFRLIPVADTLMFLLRVTAKSNQNEGNDFENDEIQMEVCCPIGKVIHQCDSESIEINDMIDLLRCL